MPGIPGLDGQDGLDGVMGPPVSQVAMEMREKYFEQDLITCM